MGDRNLKFRYHNGASVSEELLREIWTVRVEMLDLNQRKGACLRPSTSA